MRVPGRVTISWADDNTLKIELDAGTQTRLLHFDTTAAPAGTPKTLQAIPWRVGKAHAVVVADSVAAVAVGTVEALQRQRLRGGEV
jgi:hypothetical protein